MYSKVDQKNQLYFGNNLELNLQLTHLHRLRIFYNSARYIDEAFIPWENDKTNFSYQLFTAYWIEWTVQAAPRQLRRHAPAPASRPCRPGGGGGKEGRQGGGAEGGLAGGPVLAFNKQGKQLTSQLPATQWKVQ